MTLTEGNIIEAKTVFTMFSEDEDILPREKLKDVMLSLGYVVNAEDMLHLNLANTISGFTFRDVLDILNDFHHPSAKQIMEGFKSAHNKKNFMLADEVYKVYTNIGDSISSKSLKVFLNTANMQKDGTIEFKDVVHDMLEYQAEKTAKQEWLDAMLSVTNRRIATKGSL